jgi:hypothetical protein
MSDTIVIWWESARKPRNTTVRFAGQPSARTVANCMNRDCAASRLRYRARTSEDRQGASGIRPFWPMFGGPESPKQDGQGSGSGRPDANALFRICSSMSRSPACPLNPSRWNCSEMDVKSPRESAIMGTVFPRGADVPLRTVHRSSGAFRVPEEGSASVGPGSGSTSNGLARFRGAS